MASTPLYMQQYLEDIQSLPLEIQRNFILMGDLDSRARNIKCNIDKLAEKYKYDMKLKPTEKNGQTMVDIQRQFVKVKEYGDDKVQLSIQTYQLVDKQIRKLDTFLACFEDNIKNKTMIAMKNLEEEQNHGHKKDRKANKKESKTMKSEYETVAKTSKKKPFKKGGVNMKNLASSSKTSSVIGDVNPKKINKRVANVNVETNSLIGAAENALAIDVLDMPVDPYEPTYCLCNQVSFGEMIGCDNPHCFTEWFHFKCVNLSTKPKGKWFCSKCETYMKKK